jgi:hypothetical protein
LSEAIRIVVGSVVASGVGVADASVVAVGVSVGVVVLHPASRATAASRTPLAARAMGFMGQTFRRVESTGPTEFSRHQPQSAQYKCIRLESSDF